MQVCRQKTEVAQEMSFGDSTVRKIERWNGIPKENCEASETVGKAGKGGCVLKVKTITQPQHNTVMHIKSYLQSIK